MNGEVNRAVLLWQNWEEKQKMLQEVFSGDAVLAGLDRQKHNFLRNGLLRISGGNSVDEQLVLDLIKKAVAVLEKKLYPNPLLRLFRRIKSVGFDRPVELSRMRKMKADNIQVLYQAFSLQGLQGKMPDLEKHLDYQRNEIQIDLNTSYRENYSLDVRLHLQKNLAGHYQFNSYSATVKNLNPPGKEQSCDFKTDSGINIRQALNLMQGRAVLLKGLHNNGDSAATWIQVNNDVPGLRGKLMLMELDHQFNLKKELESLSQTLKQPELLLERVFRAMGQGEQVTVRMPSGELSYLQADPKNKQITIRDKDHQLIDPQMLSLKKKSTQRLEKAIVPVKKIKHRKQGHSLHIS
ncbi:hypothetical protein DBR43_09685 [Pedobacter sp. KBW06]|uniref:hypothetical protein n=1 Tax=Pedobacter sp. KBW06 TaxID=2153359 RepID=UPI000F58FB4B|nr:hypothetical protein [Pedobacter sp. KBW06]RQO75598.1 hypothetical protein DBR43_09685 [Pedobacter sp. KBW06]